MDIVSRVGIHDLTRKVLDECIRDNNNNNNTSAAVELIVTAFSENDDVRYRAELVTRVIHGIASHAEALNTALRAETDNTIKALAQRVARLERRACAIVLPRI